MVYPSVEERSKFTSQSHTPQHAWRCGRTVQSPFYRCSLCELLPLSLSLCPPLPLIIAAANLSLPTPPAAFSSSFSDASKGANFASAGASVLDILQEVRGEQHPTAGT